MNDAAPETFDHVEGTRSQFSKEVNAGIAYFLDVVVNIFLLASLLIGVFQFPSDVVFEHIVPGAVVGILAGNVLMVWLAKKTAKETNNPDVTAIPLGLDMPSVIGMVFFVLGPVYSASVAEMGPQAAGDYAWKIGMACMLWKAGFKFIFSFFGKLFQNGLPQMALVGAMVGIATVWLGAEALMGAFALPEVGLFSFGIMVYALTAGHRLPFGVPGALIAIVLPTIVYYILAYLGVGNGYDIPVLTGIHPTLPAISLGGFEVMFGPAITFFGIVFPFALLIAASSVNIVAGARILGDDYNANAVVRYDAVATLASALCGGVIQTTPHFGHSTYKRMGARTNYALGVLVVLAAGGFLGIVSIASLLVPGAVLKPILVIVAGDILRLAVTGCDFRHGPALLFSLIPGILAYAHTKVSDLYGRAEAGFASLGAKLPAIVGPDWMSGYALLTTMAHGYILVSLLWATMVIWIIDKKRDKAAWCAFLCAILTLFGVIHSIMPTSEMYWAWAIPQIPGMETLPYRFAGGYFLIGLLLLTLHFGHPDKEGEPLPELH